MDNTKELNQFTDYMQGRVSDSTLQLYVYAIEQFFMSMNGDALTPEVAQRYVDSLTKSGKSPSTVGIRAHAIMRFFRWKKIDIHLDCPSISTKRPVYLKPPEIDRVIKACRTQLEKILIVMLYDTAVRISELLNLTVDNIDWAGKTISIIIKGGREVDTNVSTKALGELKAWLNVRHDVSEKVFLDLDYYTAWEIVKGIGRRAGMPNLHPHTFRHSRAINMLKSGVKPYVVQQHLHHKSIATTMDIYGAFLAADLRDEIPEW